MSVEIPIYQWRCHCGWFGDETELGTDAYGTEEVPGHLVFHSACPDCGTWLEEEENRYRVDRSRENADKETP